VHASRVGEYAFTGHWAGVRSADFVRMDDFWDLDRVALSLLCKLGGKTQPCVPRTERKGKVGGKSALGFLERSGLEAQISGAFWSVRESGSDGEKYSWPEPRLGQIDRRT
jgi:hypothetical protein